MVIRSKLVAVMLAAGSLVGLGLPGHGLDQTIGDGSMRLAGVQRAAPNFVGISNWLNSGPLTMADLRGKVVLVNFWTYACINCIRTLPYVTKLHAAYKDKGLVIVGV